MIPKAHAAVDCDAVGNCTELESPIANTIFQAAVHVMDGTNVVLELLRQIGAKIVSLNIPPEIALGFTKGVLLAVIIIPFLLLIWKATRAIRNSVRMRLVSIKYWWMRKWRKKPMSPEERAKYVKEVFEDVITEALEDAEYTGKITRDEKNALYRKLAKAGDLQGLLPVYIAKHLPTLKAEIKTRLGNGVYKNKLPLPDAVKRTPKNKLEAMLLKH